MTTRVIRCFAVLLCLALLLLHSSCKHTTAPPPPTVLDTTSHDFIWTTYELGEGQASNFNDVAIINDTLAYAVGEIYLNDSTGQLDPTPYGIAGWDGQDWQLQKVFYNTNNVVAPRGIWPVTTSNIWLAAGSIFHWGGSGQQTELVFSRLTLPDPNATIEMLWGIGSQELCGVGNAGTIVHYKNERWQTTSSGTTVNLQDIWGNSDGKTIWACGHSLGYDQSCLLRYDNNSWTTLWSTNATLTPPYGQLVMSIWAGDTYLYVAATDGVYRTSLGGNGPVERMQTLPSLPQRIRGSGENNIAVACRNGSIWHYNGASWEQVLAGDLVKPLYSIAVSANTIVAVGFDAATINWKGRVCVGRRN